MSSSTSRRHLGSVALIAAVSLTLSAALAAPSANAKAKPKPLATAAKIRIGFFGNVTHVSALVAQQEKFFEKYFDADNTTVEYTAFTAGPAAIEALKGGSIDVTFVGVAPSVSGFTSTKSTGGVLRIISGATVGGAQFITKCSITKKAHLKGKNFATPQLGGTQDVALRAYLKGLGFKVNVLGGGDVYVTPTDNATTLTLFKNGQIDGAWVPEPWASRLVLEGNGCVYLDEAARWPKGQFVTTQVVAQTNYLANYPGTIKSLLLAIEDANDFIKSNPTKAKDDVQAQLKKWTGKQLTDAVINRAWPNITPTLDPVATSLKKGVSNLIAAGLADSYLASNGVKGAKGIYDLRILNSIRKAEGKPKYKTDNLGLW